MTEPPALTDSELAEAVRPVFRATRRSPFVAVYGSWDRVDVSKIDVDSKPLRVIPVISELDLRMRLPEPNDEEPTVFVVPWATEIPIDIRARFALNGKVQLVGPEQRLKVLLGAQQLEPGVGSSPLAKYLLDRKTPPRLSSVGGRVTLRGLVEAWLSGEWSLPAGRELGLDVLLSFAARDGRGAELRSNVPEAVRAQVAEVLRRANGPAASFVWQAWQEQRGSEALQLALLLEAVQPVDDAAARSWIHSTLPHAGVPDDDVDVVARRLTEAASRALREYERATSPGDVARLMQEAESRAGLQPVREYLARSPNLPCAWQALLDELGAALERGAARPSLDTVEAAQQAATRLGQHRYFKQAPTQLLRRIDMAGRLLTWLAARPDQKQSGSAAAHADAEVLAGWYVSEGGYVDRARRAARGTANDAFGRGVQAVVERVDAARTELDHRFAKGLSAWVDARQPATEVLPMHDVVKRVVVPFLKGDPERKLLVLLMDGMAWAQAVEILESLGERAAWAPLAWHRTKEGKVGSSAYPAVLASLPTLTEISRAAFFAGKAVGFGSKTEKDKQRWLENKLLHPFDAEPDLLLRAEGHSQDGSASQQVLSRTADPDRRLVAAVINAIDSSLKGDTQYEAVWNAESIRSLPALLDAAAQAQRAVLLVADHGHVTADRMTGSGSHGAGGARWRPWKEGDAPPGEGELLFRGSAVARPKGADGVVLLIDDERRYGGAAHAGEHGGATLAEVVAPCVLIGSPDLPADRDRALAQKPLLKPSWWTPGDWLSAETHRATVAKSAPPAAVASPPKAKPKPKPQQSLPGIVPDEAPAPTPAPEAELPALAAQLRDNELLEARAPKVKQRKRIIAAVAYLEERNGKASADSFATALGEVPFRVPGLVATLQGVLNVEGYQVLRLDAQTREVSLDTELLAQQFEVKR